MEQILSARQFDPQQSDQFDVFQPINGDVAGKNLLSIHQLSDSDIYDYIEEARAASEIVNDPARGGTGLLQFTVLKAVMRQPSTRTAGTMATAMHKLGCDGEVISGMSSSSEAKDESRSDSWLAFATQTDILATRTAEDYGPAYAAQTIGEYHAKGKLKRQVPVINLGDGKNEHPTQALSDMFTIYSRIGSLEGKVALMMGDHERYRAHHSFMIAAAKLGMYVIAVESDAVRVPGSIANLFGDRLQRTDNLDEALSDAHVLVLGRKPKEYDGEDEIEKERTRLMNEYYAKNIVNLARLQKMRPDGVELHPRPRGQESDPDIDFAAQSAEVEQMENLVPMRMAIIATHMGKSILHSK
ncbi:MAG: hypothetical protein ACREGA_04180 [Candidatus Saccharimonadales bacterium]